MLIGLDQEGLEGLLADAKREGWYEVCYDVRSEMELRNARRQAP